MLSLCSHHHSIYLIGQVDPSQGILGLEYSDWAHWAEAGAVPAAALSWPGWSARNCFPLPGFILTSWCFPDSTISFMSPWFWRSLEPFSFRKWESASLLARKTHHPNNLHDFWVLQSTRLSTIHIIHSFTNIYLLLSTIHWTHVCLETQSIDQDILSPDTCWHKSFQPP
jgi:hypothetical protein